jgi:hypothetical protein
VTRAALVRALDVTSLVARYVVAVLALLCAALLVLASCVVRAIMLAHDSMTSDRSDKR